MRILEVEDVLALLRSEVKRAGGQVAWSKKTGVSRIVLNKALTGRRPLTPSIIAALNLRVVFTPARRDAA